MNIFNLKIGQINIMPVEDVNGFVNFSVLPCRSEDDYSFTDCEESQAEFFTVYAHYDEGEDLEVANCETKTLADEVVKLLTWAGKNCHNPKS